MSSFGGLGTRLEMRGRRQDLGAGRGWEGSESLDGLSIGKGQRLREQDVCVEEREVVRLG